MSRTLLFSPRPDADLHIRVCVLEMDNLKRYEDAQEDSKTYPQLFEKWFRAGDSKCTVEITAFDVAHTGEFPLESELDAFDLFMITGSEHSVYEEIDFVRKTQDFIRRLRQEGRKMIGICFGHQCIAHALGGKTTKNPNGVEMGWADFRLTEEAAKLYATEPNRLIKLLYIHGDHVDTVPPGFVSMGGNEKTPVQGMLSEDHTVITFQGHPEFNKEVLDVILSSNDDIVVKTDALVRASSRKSLVKETDSAFLLQQTLRFLKFRPQLQPEPGSGV